MTELKGTDRLPGAKNVDAFVIECFFSVEHHRIDSVYHLLI